MATKDKDGNWKFDEEEESQIEILARSRVRADELREQRKKEADAAAEEEAKKNPKKKKKFFA